MSKVVTVVGGHGKIALRLAKLLSADHKVKSIIRTPEHSADLTSISSAVTPIVASLENDPVSKFTDMFEDTDVVVFSAGAGGKGGPERTEKVDYQGALKVFDAIEAVQRAGEKPRLLLVSSIDTRDRNIVIPSHYNEDDVRHSENLWKTLATYMHWKYEADKNLVARTAFKWTIVRPGRLTDEAPAGKASIGKTHMGSISRDDVANTLALLVDRPDAAGLVLDVVDGDVPIEEALQNAMEKRISAWVG